MALKIVRDWESTILDLKSTEQGMYEINHIFEPEFHQEIYVEACEKTKNIPGAFQIGKTDLLKKTICRGMQPKYADDENDVDTLIYEGMVLSDGTRQNSNDGNENVCALKSNCIRNGYIDTSLARCVSRNFYEKNKERAGVEKNDVLINSTGDGTIGRVAVYNYDFPAIVDGHVTILRYKDKELAWYVAAYLITKTGQNQIYRYINGSSGQVEIYPQDIARIWIKPASEQKIKKVYREFSSACQKHDEFYRDLTSALNDV
ncbi:MAG: hypothetical protein EOM00_12620 [Clostridia bacterium]|nr:hypothetical protein [Clostridia bacterium]